MEIKTATTVATLSASSLTSYFQHNVSSEYALVVVAISSLIGLTLTVIYYHNKTSTLLASAGFIASLFLFLPIYTYVAKSYGDVLGFFASLLIAFIIPFIVVYASKSSSFKSIIVLLEEYLVSKVKEILQKNNK